MVLHKPGHLGDQKKPVAVAGYRWHGGSLDRLSGPQNIGYLQGWSTHSTPGCLEVEK